MESLSTSSLRCIFENGTSEQLVEYAKMIVDRLDKKDLSRIEEIVKDRYTAIHRKKLERWAEIIGAQTSYPYAEGCKMVNSRYTLYIYRSSRCYELWLYVGTEKVGIKELYSNEMDGFFLKIKDISIESLRSKFHMPEQYCDI